VLTPRNVIIIFIVLVAISLASACLALVQSPTGGVNGRDSFGTRTYGFRGLYETLEALGVPVERELLPPDRSLDRGATLAIFEPDPVIVTTEPAYLHKVAEWVKEGGAIVVIPSQYVPKRAAWPLREWPPRSPLEELSLPDVLVAPFRAHGTNPQEEDEDSDREKLHWPHPTSASDTLDSVLGRNADIPMSFVHATLDGELAARFPQGLRLAVPAKDPRVITELAKMPGSHVRAVLEPDGTPQILAAVYSVGRGTIAVLADARLAQNAFLGRDDNALLAVQLLAEPKRPVIFDEFYHGRTVRGNPLWLATRFPYSALALTVLGATLLVGWRAARILGPPVPRQVPSRRTLAEYIEAMARLLNRSRQPLPYLLGELRSGLLWRIRRELTFPPGRDDPQKLLQVLSRRDPTLAENLSAALGSLDQVLESPSPSPQVVKATLAKVSHCVSVPRRSV
jgi:Domain of unknown function (DUF4350)